MTATPSDIDSAVDALKNGDLIGMPTETVYGLAGDAGNPSSVAKIYALKNRPAFNPLIAHVCSMQMASKIGQFSQLATRLAEAFWPGPLTLVVPASDDSPVCDLARAGLDTQAIRWPAHKVATEVIRLFERPVVAPSANKSGRISPTTSHHVRSEFGSDLGVLLDGGASVLGLESTVIAIIGNEATLLRSGSLDRADIERITGPLTIAGQDDTAPISPGMLSKHYAPNARLRLMIDSPDPDEAYLAFGPAEKFALNLSETSDLKEAASNLYAMLRELDLGHDKIAVAPIPETGLGEAINDRLRRAALK